MAKQIITIGPRGGKIVGYTGRQTEAGTPEAEYLRTGSAGPSLHSPAEITAVETEYRRLTTTDRHPVPSAEPEEAPQSSREDWSRFASTCSEAGILQVGPAMERFLAGSEGIRDEATLRKRVAVLAAETFADLGFAGKVAPGEMLLAMGHGLKLSGPDGDEATGQVTHIGYSKERDGSRCITIVSKFRSKATGNVVVTMSRDYWIEKRPGGGVDRFAAHDLFKIDDAWQGRGIAKRIIPGQYELYMRAGFSHIRTYANDKNGGYTWALFGFEFENPEEDGPEVVRAVANKVREVRGLDDGQTEDLVREISDKVGYDAPALARLNIMGVDAGKAMVPLGWHGRMSLAQDNPWLAEAFAYAFQGRVALKLEEL